MIFLGVDLAWGAGTTTKVPAETGVVALDASGRVVDATWIVGIPDTLAWAARHADSDALMFVDAPLVVLNPAGQRLCEKHVGQRYGRWKVSANSTNLESKSLAGVRLREAAESASWRYSSGAAGPPSPAEWCRSATPTRRLSAHRHSDTSLSARPISGAHAESSLLIGRNCAAGSATN